MVGIVIVSHSEMAARGIQEIVQEMVGDDAPVVPVGGGEGNFGTSVPQIQGAIEEASDGDGVVVFVDLGSSVMNAQTALDTSEINGVLADAPILEGALNAAVTAASGGSLEEVHESANETRDASKFG